MHRLAVLAALALLAAAPAAAVPVFPGLITVEEVGSGITTIDSEVAGCVESSPGSRVYGCDGSGQYYSPDDYDWTLSDWDLGLDTDPSISSAFGFTNDSGSTQTYVITVSIPVVLFGPASLVGGSTGGSTTDASNDGMGGLSTSAPFALYEGLVDGALRGRQRLDDELLRGRTGSRTLDGPAARPRTRGGGPPPVPLILAG